jgi:glycerol-3-phosphate dehydrogenase
VTEPCRTATEVLPGADHGTHRLAEPLARVERDMAYGELICECELVTRGQVRDAVADGLTELEDLRRRLRLGYGPCQAAFCAWRAAGMLAEAGPAGDPVAGLERFLEERWRGQRSTIWGDQARQALLNHAIYRGIFDLQGAGIPDEAAAPTEGPGAGPPTGPGEGDPTRRVGDELVGDTEGRTSSRGSGG